MTGGMLPLLLVLLAFVSLASGQMDCSKAPSASLRTVCMQLNGWDRKVRALPTEKYGVVHSPGTEPGDDNGLGTSGPPRPLSMQECIDFESLCKFSDGKLNKQAHECTVPGRGVMRKAYRKEYRVMSDEERERYHAALQETKKGGYFDSVAVSHARFADAGGAHAGVAFLGWHREQLKRMEISLRTRDLDVSVPYWDSAMDSYLPTPADSIIWTDAFMGNDQGPVTSGPFAGWTSYEKNRKLTRKVGADGAAFNETNIQEFMAFTDFHQVLAPTAPHAGCPHMPTFSAIEYTHGNVHLFVGGDMHETNTSAYDPIFYSLHSFVDLLWEAWRLKNQNRTARETEYPLDNTDCSSSTHFAAAEMNPFHPWRNTDGLSNNYTDELYEYAPRPACPSCSDSKYLFCLRSKFKCASKIRPGGNCQGLDPADQPCYNSTCQNGKCVFSELAVRRRPIALQRPVASASDSQSEPCFNFQPCCETWSAAGECNKNPNYMRYSCKASCGVCTPRTYALTDDCDNRHARCQEWTMTGECLKNYNWMSENCRRSCGRCGRTRAQSCPGGKAERARPQPQQPPQNLVARTNTENSGITDSCYSPHCFNENMCCQLWGMQGECTRNPAWMNCNCRVACGKCRPSYEYGGCRDHHSSCPYWASMGQCDQNDWMLENCRASCRSCYNNWELSQLCSAYGGRRPRSAGFGFLAAIGADRAH